MKRDLKRVVVYPHPPDDVWRALTDPVALAEWLMPSNFEPRVGHEFQFQTTPRPGFRFDGTIRCKVVALDAPRRLVYSWRAGSLDTVVTWTLEAVE